MPPLRSQTRQQREATLRRTLRAFEEFCRIEFSFHLYAYQRRVAEACLRSLLVEPQDVAIKIARQSGKTESVTLLLRFLIIFHRLLTGDPLMCGIASPKGEQAKTDVDRVKKSVSLMRARWQVEDREFNAATVRAYRHDNLHAEIFKFSLAPTTSNESKTINLLIVEEAHLADDAKRSNELDPMLASTGGVTWMIGVGCTRLCDYYRACRGEVPGTVTIVVPVDEVIRDRRLKYEQTGDDRHLEYERAFTRELRKKGKNNPELRRNYYLEDQVEAGNFVSRERFTGCARPEWQRKDGILIPVDDLTLAIDWGRVSDSTWVGVMTRSFDLLAMWKIPRERYERQIDQILTELRMPRKCLKRVPDGGGWREVEEEFTYFDRITTVRGDSTGLGDFPMEYLQTHAGLPMGEESLVKFTLESKNEMYTTLEAAIFRDAGDPLRLSYWAGDPLAGELEEQTTTLLREYKTDRQLLSPRAPEVPGAHDDAPTMLALNALGASQGRMGDILIA
jgi:hypothetical protein